LEYLRAMERIGRSDSGTWREEKGVDLENLKEIERGSEEKM